MAFLFLLIAWGLRGLKNVEEAVWAAIMVWVQVIREISNSALAQ